MSQESFVAFCNKLQSDETFRLLFERDPEWMAQRHDLSPTEMVALVSGDSDAQQRLAGDEVSGFSFDLSRFNQGLSGLGHSRDLGVTIFQLAPGMQQLGGGRDLSGTISQLNGITSQLAGTRRDLSGLAPTKRPTD